MAHPTLNGTPTNEGGTSLGTNQATVLPSDIVNGELLLCAIAVDNTTAITLGTGSATWATVFSVLDSGNSKRLCLLGRIATGTDTLVVTGGASDYRLATWRVGGHGVTDLATDIVVATKADGASGNADPPSLNAGSSADWMWLALACIDATTGNTISASPTNYTTVHNAQSNNNTTSCMLGSAYRALTASSEDPGTFTNSSQEWVTQTVAIPPVGGVTGQATASFGFTATAAGVDRALGSATAAFGGTFTAAGVTGAPPVEGQATAAFGFTATAAGIDRAVGVAVVAFGYTATANGRPRHIGVAVASFGFTAAAEGGAWEIPATVPAAAETAVPGGASGDVADTPWIWRNRADPEASFILGSNKSTGADGGVYTYNLDGTLASVTHWLIGAVNAVNGRDLGYSEYSNVAAGWADRVLVIGTNRSDNDLNYGWMDRDTGEITSAGATSLAFEPYGCTLYVSPSTGDVHAFVSEATGGSNALRQYELSVSGDTVSGTQVRVLDTASLAEGMCTWEPDEWFFLTEEDEGLYRYDAEPDGGTSRVEVDPVGGGNLTADVEAVTVAAPYGPADGYIIVSSQGSSEFAVYELADPHVHVANFEVVANGGIDATTETDGADIVREPFGATWPDGLFVAHDATNTGGAASNFKLVDAGDVFGPLPAASATGQASAAFGFTATAAGIDRAVGAAAAVFGFIATGSGVDRALGAAVASFGFTGSANGVPRVRAAAVASFGFTATTTGFAGTPPVQGQATATFGGTFTANGIDRALGVAVATLGFTATAAGVDRAIGTATASLGYTAAALGTRRAIGQATTSFGFAAAVFIITYRLAVTSTPGPRFTATPGGRRHTAAATASRYVTED